MINIKSMTGFGVAKGGTEASNLEVNIRSVNGRFLETRVHLPRELASTESEIKKILSQAFQRGSIDVFISRKSRGERSNLKLHLHEEMARAWVATAERLETFAPMKEKLDLKTLLQLPEVVGFEEEATSIEKDVHEVLRLVAEACATCTEERKREGEALKQQMLGHLACLEDLVGEMDKLRDEVNRQLREKMEARLSARWADLEFDSQRLQQELAILWDKADITEEMARLREHLLHYRKLLSSSVAQGKKLDFYTQELLREVNTIGSKSPMAQLTHRVVMAKTEIEKLREQVQNIE